MGVSVLQVVWCCIALCALCAQNLCPRVSGGVVAHTQHTHSRTARYHSHLRTSGYSDNDDDDDDDGIAWFEFQISIALPLLSTKQSCNPLTPTWPLALPSPILPTVTCRDTHTHTPHCFHCFLACSCPTGAFLVCCPPLETNVHLLCCFAAQTPQHLAALYLSVRAVSTNINATSPPSL